MISRLMGGKTGRTAEFGWNCSEKLLEILPDSGKIPNFHVSINQHSGISLHGSKVRESFDTTRGEPEVSSQTGTQEAEPERLPGRGTQPKSPRSSLPQGSEHSQQDPALKICSTFSCVEKVFSTLSILRWISSEMKTPSHQQRKADRTLLLTRMP